MTPQPRRDRRRVRLSSWNAPTTCFAAGSPPRAGDPRRSEDGPCFLRTQRSETRANLFAEELRLLPRSEVPAFRQPVVVNELRIRLFRPAPRRIVELVGKRADSRRDLDALRREEARLVLPVQPRC